MEGAGVRGVTRAEPLSFVDLFSGAGGMSFGFSAHPAFRQRAAMDGEFGKPSSAPGSLGCNETFRLNLGLAPTPVDLSKMEEADIRTFRTRVLQDQDLDVLSSCPPCTGFSRANPSNHLKDDRRNSLVLRTQSWVRVLRPKVLVMENARELLKGNFAHHFLQLKGELEQMGYAVKASIHMLDRFGLPQRRERALVVATTLPGGPRGLEELWAGYRINPEATTVRRAIAALPPLRAGEKDDADPFHACPTLNTTSAARIAAIPHNGGSWIDLHRRPGQDLHLTPAMRRYIAAGDFGSHPDVYGRLAWDRPAMTIKRECSHVGNGRYAHPEQDRLCSLRELAILQGFPRTYRFGGGSLSNMYRHIGDAVPPLISFQLAHAVHWMFTGERPEPADFVLPNTSLQAEDIACPQTPKLNPASAA